MKLPTLNVDVTVNAKTMKKGIAEANKQMQAFGKQTLAIGGGGFGKIGAFAGAAGSFGMAGLSTPLLAFGTALLGATAVVKTAQATLTTLEASTKRGSEALTAMSEGKPYQGIDIGAAGRLAMAAPAAEIQATSAKGVWDTFIAGTMNAQGEMEGLAGWISDWAGYTSEGVKVVAAGVGAALAGEFGAEAQRRMDMAGTRSAAGGQAYMTTEEINRQADFVAFERNRKAQREQNT